MCLKIFEYMTPMDIVDLIQIVEEAISAGMQAAALYITIVSGYLILIYSAGQKISKYLNVLVTSLFIVFSLFFSAGSYQFFSLAHEYSVNFGAELGAIPLGMWWAWILGTAQLLGIVGCLVYMYQVRKE